MVPPILRILETALYVEDVARAREFYVRLFGFPVVMEDDRLCALRVGDFQGECCPRTTAPERATSPSLRPPSPWSSGSGYWKCRAWN